MIVRFKVVDRLGTLYFETEEGLMFDTLFPYREFMTGSISISRGGVVFSNGVVSSSRKDPDGTTLAFFGFDKLARSGDGELPRISAERLRRDDFLVIRFGCDQRALASVDSFLRNRHARRPGGNAKDSAKARILKF